MNAILTYGLTAGHMGVPTVRDLDLHVDDGEIVALLGPNGAGKTTTLMTIAGVLPAIGGSVEVLGRRVHGRSPHQVARRGLSFVPENRGLFHQLTVDENLRLGARPAGSLSTNDVLTLFPELGSLRSRRCGLLSGGEQQMLGLAKALVGDVRVLMIDEMSLGLAPIIVERLLPVIRTIATEQGIGVLLVEQHVHMALEVADRAYVLNHGELVLEGTGSDLLRDRHLLQASYLGSVALSE